jgi:hypothetical protein
VRKVLLHIAFSREVRDGADGGAVHVILHRGRRGGLGEALIGGHSYVRCTSK